jgi:hypothetical protein
MPFHSDVIRKARLNVSPSGGFGGWLPRPSMVMPSFQARLGERGSSETDKMLLLGTLLNGPKEVSASPL